MPILLGRKLPDQPQNLPQLARLRVSYPILSAF